MSSLKCYFAEFQPLKAKKCGGQLGSIHTMMLNPDSLSEQSYFSAYGHEYPIWKLHTDWGREVCLCTKCAKKVKKMNHRITLYNGKSGVNTRAGNFNSNRISPETDNFLEEIDEESGSDEDEDSDEFITNKLKYTYDTEDRIPRTAVRCNKEPTSNTNKTEDARRKSELVNSVKTLRKRNNEQSVELEEANGKIAQLERELIEQRQKTEDARSKSELVNSVKTLRKRNNEQSVELQEANARISELEHELVEQRQYASNMIQHAQDEFRDAQVKRRKLAPKKNISLNK